jgi:hypothetical protein
MATFLSFHKNALTKLFVVLLAILLIQQHVVQVDGQMCDPRMFSKCLTKIYIYTFSACPEGKYCSWFWCYDCLKNGAGVYNYKGLNSIPGLAKKFLGVAIHLIIEFDLIFLLTNLIMFSLFLFHQLISFRRSLFFHLFTAIWMPGRTI